MLYTVASRGMHILSNCKDLILSAIQLPLHLNNCNEICVEQVFFEH